MVYFVIRVIENGNYKYVFNSRVLLGDVALARTFPTVALAHGYMKKSKHASLSYSVKSIIRSVPTIDRRTLGGIVE